MADARVTVLSRVYVAGTDEWRRMLGEGELGGGRQHGQDRPTSTSS